MVLYDRWGGGGTFIRQRRALGALSARYAWWPGRFSPYPLPWPSFYDRWGVKLSILPQAEPEGTKTGDTVDALPAF